MKTNNPSDSNKMKDKDLTKDANDRGNEKRSMNQSGNSDMDSGSSQTGSDESYSKTNYGSNKGTGMSSEAGSNQTERSWQGTGGSQKSSRGSGNMSNSGDMRNSGNMGGSDNMGSNSGKGSGNLNTDNIKNQSEQQRRSSMGDGTPETGEKNLKNNKLGDEELNDVDWNAGNTKNK